MRITTQQKVCICRKLVYFRQVSFTCRSRRHVTHRPRDMPNYRRSPDLRRKGVDSSHPSPAKVRTHCAPPERSPLITTSARSPAPRDEDQPAQTREPTPPSSPISSTNPSSPGQAEALLCGAGEGHRNLGGGCIREADRFLKNLENLPMPPHISIIMVIPLR
jgi:hypothetical protein